MTTSANQAGTEGRAMEEVCTSIVKVGRGLTPSAASAEPCMHLSAHTALSVSPLSSSLLALGTPPAFLGHVTRLWRISDRGNAYGTPTGFLLPTYHQGLWV